jgi:hypothetical protein
VTARVKVAQASLPPFIELVDAARREDEHVIGVAEEKVVFHLAEEAVDPVELRDVQWAPPETQAE